MSRRTVIDLRKSLRKHGHYLWLPLVPLLWVMLAEQGSLDDLKHLAMDLRYHVRGPLDVDQKVVYVNRDGWAAERWGQAYFPRSVYAECAQAVLEEGGAEAVFLDFVLSQFYRSKMLNNEALIEADEKMAQLIQKHPGNIVLAASYAGTQDRAFQSDMFLPRIVNGPWSAENPTGYSPANNPVPELPKFPLWVPDLQTADSFPRPQGRIGLINTDVELDRGAAPRFVPAFVEVSNELTSLHYLTGFIYWMQATTDPEEVGDEFYQDIMSLRVVDSEDGAEMLVRDRTGIEFGRVRKVTDQTFFTAAISLYLATHPGSEAVVGEGEVLLYGPSPAGRSVQKRIPLFAKQAMEINWFSPWQDPEVRAGDRPASQDRYNPQMSMVEVADHFERLRNPGTSEEDRRREQAWFRQHFEGAVVLMGPTDVLLQDLAPTPFDAGTVPKVSVHGNAYKTIITGRFIHRLPNWVEWLLAFLLTGCVTTLTIAGGSKTRINKIAAMLILAGYVLASLELFRYFELVIPLVAPLGAALSTSMLGAVVQLIQEEQHKSRIQGMFGSYVSPKVVQRLLAADEAPQLGGQSLEITAFFSDIQSFSSFSEVLSPDELVVLMNEYLNAMTEIMESEEGTLDKYIGDAIVAMFGAPVRTERHAYQACRTAVLIQQRQAELREHWRSLGDRWPSLVHHMQTRIGLNTGLAVVGNMGSRKRFNYTMMGDTVNLAARNESGAKSYGVYIMVSEDTRDQATKDGDDLVFRYLDRIVVKGRSQPVAVYELIGFREQLVPLVSQCLETYRRAMEHYLRQEWDAAQQLFCEAAPCEPFQPDAEQGIETNPSLVMAARCDYWRQNPPPAGWDGRWIMKSK